MAGTCSSENLRFWKNDRVPFFKFSQTRNWVSKMSTLVRIHVFENQQKMVFANIQFWEQLPKSKSPFSATHTIIWHIWKDGSRKVNNDEPDMRIYHGNFWPVMSQAVWKPCFLTSIPRGHIPRFPDTAGTGGAAGQTLKSRSRPLPTHPWMKYFRKGIPSLLITGVFLHLCTVY